MHQLIFCAYDILYVCGCACARQLTKSLACLTVLRSSCVGSEIFFRRCFCCLVDCHCSRGRRHCGCSPNNIIFHGFWIKTKLKIEKKRQRGRWWMRWLVANKNCFFINKYTSISIKYSLSPVRKPLPDPVHSSFRVQWIVGEVHNCATTCCYWCCCGWWSIRPLMSKIFLWNHTHGTSLR